MQCLSIDASARFMCARVCVCERAHMCIYSMCMCVCAEARARVCVCVLHTVLHYINTLHDIVMI